MVQSQREGGGEGGLGRDDRDQGLFQVTARMGLVGEVLIAHQEVPCPFTSHIYNC